MEFLILLWIFSAVSLTGVYLFYAFQLQKIRASPKAPPQAASVIICARNELKNLQQNLPSILHQQFPEYEVLVILDSCEDGSEEFLQSLQSQYPHLRFLGYKGSYNLAGKKGALRFGVENAKHDLVVLTDADCYPASNNWLSSISSHFPPRQIVLGFGAYKRVDHWVNRLVRWETLHAASNYFSMAKWGKPYMGVGRNMAYQKELFLQSDRFEAHRNLPSGDDDLFVSGLKGVNTGVELRPEAQTISEAPSNLKEWWKQKRRHMSTAFHYSAFHKFWLGSYAIAQFLFYFLLPFMIINTGHTIWVWSVILVKLLMQYGVLYPFAKRLKKSEDYIWWPLMEALYVIFAAVITIQNLISKPRFWN